MTNNANASQVRAPSPEEDAQTVMLIITAVARALPRAMKMANVRGAEFKLCATVGTGQLGDDVFPSLTLGLRPERNAMPEQHFQAGIGCLTEVVNRFIATDLGRPHNKVAIKLSHEPVP